KCGNMRFIQRNNVSVNEVAENNSGFNVYPNPAVGAVAFQYNYTGSDVNVVVKDLTGKIVHNATLKGLNGTQEMHIDVSSFAPGMYILELYGKDEKLTSKFTVSK